MDAQYLQRSECVEPREENGMLRPQPSWMHGLSSLTLTEWAPFFAMHEAQYDMQGPRESSLWCEE